MKAIARGRTGSAVLDVGCGSGCLSLPLARPAGHVTGIDTSGRGNIYDVGTAAYPAH